MPFRAARCSASQAWLGPLLGALALVGACHDPVKEQAKAALGPEDPAVPPGPLHRPNQPCLVCHGAGGEAPTMAFAGTVYLDPDGRIAAPNADIVVVDAMGREQRVRSNCAGNFFLEDRGDWPRFPVWTSAEVGEHRIDMESPIYREGSCAACHGDPAGPSSAGHVFLTDDPSQPVTLPPNDCRGRP
jgi:mono/diheme cytochrome c family protein